jgi:hypothetical protein
MKKAVHQVLTVLVERGDFETRQEAWDAHREDFLEMREMLLEDPFGAEEFFTDTFGLEPDFFEPFVFAVAF